jgi:hypothetical protein
VIRPQTVHPTAHDPAINAKGHPETRIAPNDHLPINNYFLVLSFLALSTAILVESAAILVESADILAESADILVESALASVLALLLQAANAAIAATKKNFFICDCFDVN